MIKQTLRTIGIFAVLIFPVVALTFWAYTFLHQVVLFFGVLIAAWAAFHLSKMTVEEKRLNREVFQQASELKKAKEALDSCLATTAQAPVYTRRFLDSKLAEECNRARRYLRLLSCLLVSIDSFSTLSRDYGSVVSEALFHEVARFLRESVRSVDTLIRYKEDQLVVMLPETSLTQAGIAANRMRFAVGKNTFHINREPFKLTLSMSVVIFDPAIHRNQEDVLVALETLLVQARQSGPNQGVGI